MYHVVKYTGPFGYIKPWSAVRDELTASQTFLAPGTVQGISQKLFGLGQRNRVVAHRISHAGISLQKEMIWPKHRKKQTDRGVLDRGVMLEPWLFLAFQTEADARHAFTQHICLCRNEDVLLPCPVFGIQEKDTSAFAELGCGLEPAPQGIPVGLNRYEADAEGFHTQAYGHIVGLERACRVFEL